jgi:hypothetical protein
MSLRHLEPLARNVLGAQDMLKACIWAYVLPWAGYHGSSLQQRCNPCPSSTRPCAQACSFVSTPSATKSSKSATKNLSLKKPSVRESPGHASSQKGSGSVDAATRLFKAAVISSIVTACYMNANGIYGSVRGAHPHMLTCSPKHGMRTCAWAKRPDCRQVFVLPGT